MKNYWCENDDLLMKNIEGSIHRYNERLSLSSSSPLLKSKILHFIFAYILIHR